MKNTLAVVLALPALAAAHEGHGAPPLHGHATDAFGLVVVAVLLGALWWSRRK